MQIIPVIDIKSGHVVLAKLGQRHQYQPLATPLCQSSHISDVIEAYLSIHTFTRFYIADLDAIMGTGDNQSLINAVFHRFPDLQFMIDDGYPNTAYTLAQYQQLTPVIGTESISMQDLSSLHTSKKDFILSLDFSAQQQQMGAAKLYENTGLWPQKIIIMTLARVGANRGPDLTKLKHFCHQYPLHTIIAAGGIRHYQDLLQLQQLGITTALVSSALHNGSLTPADIKKLCPVFEP